MTEDGYRSAKRDELDSIVERFSRGSTESMSSAAAIGDRLHKEYLVPAYTHVVKALAALPPDGGRSIEARRREIEALRDSLRALIVGTVVLNGALNTVAQGFRQVVTTIGNLPSRPAPTVFNEPDGQLTWLDRPPLEVYEAGVLSNLNIVRTAEATYRTDAEVALRGLRGFTTGPDELSFATTTPVRPRAAAAGRAGSGRAGSAAAVASTEFGPIGHAAEDAALADEQPEQARPVQETGVRFRPSPAGYQPVIVAPNTEKTIFDVDGPVVPPVIGE